MKRGSHHICIRILACILAFSMFSALLPLSGYTIEANAAESSDSTEIATQAVREPVLTDKLSVTNAPGSVTVGDGATYTTTLGTSPNGAVLLPTGCGYCPSTAGCGDGCLDSWGYCSCTVNDPGGTIERTPYLELVNAGDAAVASVTLDASTGELSITGLSIGGTTSVQVRAVMDAPSPQYNDNQSNAYGRVSATVTIPVSVTASALDWTGYSLSTSHSGEVVYGDASMGASIGTDDQVVTVGLTYDQPLKITDEAALNACFDRSDIYIGTVSNTFKSITACLSDDSKTLYLYCHLRLAPFGSQLHIPDIDTLNGLVSAYSGRTARLTSLGTPGPVVPNGITFDTVDQTIATDTERASVTTKVTVPASSTRSMIHILLLKNGLPAYTTDSYNANCTAHDHDYLSMTNEKFAELLYCNTDGKESGYLLSSYGSDYTFSTAGDTVTITAKSSSAGDILDLRLIAYPIDRDTMADKTALNSTIAVAKATDTTGYTDNTIRVLNDEIAYASAIAASSNYTQDEVNEENDTLVSAISSLAYPAPAVSPDSLTGIIKAGESISVTLNNATQAWISSITEIRIGSAVLDASQYSITLSGTDAVLTLKRTDDKPIVSGTGRIEKSDLIIDALKYESIDSELSFINYSADSFQLRIVDGDGNTIPVKTFTRNDLTAVEESQDAYYQTIGEIAGLCSVKAKGVLLTTLLTNAGVDFSAGMTLKLRTNISAVSENDSTTDNAYYAKGVFSYDDLLGQKRYYFPSVYTDTALIANILAAGKMDDTVRSLIGSSGNAIEVTPMIALDYTESRYRDTNGTLPSGSYSSLISNERSYRFLFGLARDAADSSSIADTTTSLSSACCVFGIDIVDPDNHDKANTEALINAIGNVTKESKDAITSARTAYDALQPYEKAAISNYSTLTAAEQSLIDLGKVENIFSDVSADSWYHDAVQYVYDKKIMTGMDPTHFGGAETLSRGQFATMLYRIEGSQAISYTSKFPDVPDNMFYTSAVLWASQSSVGIIKGYADGSFGPADIITREQMAVMLYRYAKYKAYTTSIGDTTAFDAFPDVSNVSSFAEEPMKWAVYNKFITGNAGRIDPQGEASRAQCATILMRVLKAYTNN